MNSERSVPASVTVVIVNWNSGTLVRDCVDSLAAERSALASLEAVIVDNASSDDSVDLLEDHVSRNAWQSWVRVIRSDVNGGFAAGNNIGIRDCFRRGDKPDFFMLLNPDTYIRPGAVACLAEFLLEHPEAGIAGSRSEDPDGTAQHCCFRFPTAIAEFAAHADIGLIDRLAGDRIVRIGIPEEDTEVDWVSGGAMMIRRELFEQLDLMDEAYFLYFEETDFTLRASRAGWTRWHIPRSRVVHLVGQSTGVNTRDGAPKRVPSYWFESRRRFFVLNYGVIYAAIVDLAVLIAGGLSVLRSFVQPQKVQLKPHYYRDLLRHSVLVKGRSGLAPRRVSL